MQKAGEFSYYLEYLICQVTFAYPQTSNLLCFWARVITLHNQTNGGDVEHKKTITLPLRHESH